MDMQKIIGALATPDNLIKSGQGEYVRWCKMGNWYFLPKYTWPKWYTEEEVGEGNWCRAWCFMGNKAICFSAILTDGRVAIFPVDGDHLVEAPTCGEFSERVFIMPKDLPERIDVTLIKRVAALENEIFTLKARLCGSQRETRILKEERN